MMKWKKQYQNLVSYLSINYYKYIINFIRFIKNIIKYDILLLVEEGENYYA